MPSKVPRSSTTIAMCTVDAPETLQHAEHRHQVDHEGRLAGGRDDVDGAELALLLQEVLGVGDADHLLDVAARHWVTGMAGLGDLREQLLRRIVRVEPIHRRSRHHDRAHGAVADA